jgi:pimeloyl-ACP methyl ester carboxylesterase
MIPSDTPIVILHGLGNRSWTLTGLEWFLNWKGYPSVYRPQYNADTLPERSVVQVTRLLVDVYRIDKTQPIVVIGNSMGGVVAASLCKLGWTIRLMIAVNSPLNGATLLRELDAMLPTWVMQRFGGNTATYEYLKQRIASEIPPHPYKTIGMTLPFLDMDGLVYSKDSMIEPEHHRAIGWGSHHTVIFDPRVYLEILRLLQTE